MEIEKLSVSEVADFSTGSRYARHKTAVKETANDTSLIAGLGVPGQPGPGVMLILKGFGVALGLALGAGLGAAFNNSGTGLAVGMAIGASIHTDPLVKDLLGIQDVQAQYLNALTGQCGPRDRLVAEERADYFPGGR